MTRDRWAPVRRARIAVLCSAVACAVPVPEPAPPSPTEPLPPPVFEIALWPGEGVPVIEAARERLVLRRQPRLDAVIVDTLNVARGTRLAFDSTRYQTITPSTVRVLTPAGVRGRFLGARQFLSRDAYYSSAFRDTVVRVAPPDTFEYLQYRAEGTCFVRIRGAVIDADPCPDQDRAAFQLSGQPVTRWWIHAGVAAAAGWLPVMDSTARVVDRRF